MAAEEALQNDSCSQQFSEKCRRLFSKKTLLIIALGQVLSLCLCGTGTFSQLLQAVHHIEAPTSQLFCNYILLVVVFLSQLIYRGKFMEALKTRGWKYGLLGIIDVEANYLIVKAYQYTNLTSVQVINCICLPTVLVLSFIFFKVRYKCMHYLGVLVCLTGIACLITADYFRSKNDGPGSNQVLGDVLAICGSFLLGVSNVSQEFLVKNFDVVEYLGMLGLAGAIVSSIQMSILEHQQLTDIEWNTDVGLYLFGFIVCVFLFYILMPMVIMMSSAIVVNLSLLTANFFTLVVGLFVFKYKFSALYFVGFTAVVIGLIMYNSKPVPTAPPSDQNNGQLITENDKNYCTSEETQQ